MKPTHSNLGKAARTLGVALLALQSACTTQETTTPTAAAPLSAYDQAIELLTDGKQSNAERIVEAACATDPANPDLWFLRGVLERSRFSKHDAALCLTIAWSLDPTTYRAKAAKAVLFMDRQRKPGFGTPSILLEKNPDELAKQFIDYGNAVDSGFQTLEKIIEEHPDDLLVRWLFALQCREHRWAKYHRAEEGARQYEAILREWDPGPVLIHQTYANILSEQLGRHEEALIHRKIAVEQSYKAWTCQGYGNTLRKLGRFDEAIEWLEKAVELDPDSSDYKRSLKNARREKLRLEKASTPFAQATFFSGGYAENLPKALELYEKAVEEGDASSYIQMGIIYRNGGVGLPKNQAKAAECFEKGCDAGLWHCATLLGVMYEFGHAGSPNEEMALRWFRRGAEHDQYRSVRHLVYYYAAHSDPAKWDIKKAQECLKQLIRLHPDSSDTQSLTAMVHAQAREFDQAIAIQEMIAGRYVEEDKDSDLGGTVGRVRRRLACYQQGKPWADDVHWPPSPKKEPLSHE